MVSNFYDLFKHFFESISYNIPTFFRNFFLYLNLSLASSNFCVEHAIADSLSGLLRFWVAHIHIRTCDTDASWFGAKSGTLWRPCVSEIPIVTGVTKAAKTAQYRQAWFESELNLLYFKHSKEIGLLAK